MFEYLVSCYLLNYRRGKSKNEKNCMKRKQYSDKSNVSVLSLLLIEIGKLSLTLLCIKWVPRDPSSIFFATSYTQKMPEISDSMYFSFFMLENIRHYHFTWNGLNSQESLNFLRFSSGPQRPTIGAKFTISSEFSSLQVKWWYLTFSSLKKEEYMESKISGIFFE